MEKIEYFAGFRVSDLMELRKLLQANNIELSDVNEILCKKEVVLIAEKDFEIRRLQHKLNQVKMAIGD